MFCYANIGTPKNPDNPYYRMTDSLVGGRSTNPHGFNSLGINYIDYGLAADPNPVPDGTVFNNPATNAPFLGLFKTPSSARRGLAADPDLREGVHAQRLPQEPPGSCTSTTPGTSP